MRYLRATIPEAHAQGFTCQLYCYIKITSCQAGGKIEFKYRNGQVTTTKILPNIPFELRIKIPPMQKSRRIIERDPQGKIIKAKV